VIGQNIRSGGQCQAQPLRSLPAVLKSFKLNALTATKPLGIATGNRGSSRQPDWRHKTARKIRQSFRPGGGSDGSRPKSAKQRKPGRGGGTATGCAAQVPVAAKMNFLFRGDGKIV